MAFMTLTERTRVWNSLDDNLRQQVKDGKMSIQEAAQYVVPIGDVEMATMRAAAPVAAPVAAPPKEEYGLGTMLDTGLINLEATGQAAGALLDVQNADLAKKAVDYRDVGFLDALSKEYSDSLGDGSIPENVPLPYKLPYAVGSRALAGGDALVNTITAKLQAAKLSDEELEAEQARSISSLSTNVAQLESVNQQLKQLPPNPYSSNFIKYFDEGDYLRAAAAAPLAIATTFGEQAPTLLAQLGITAGTFAVTRNKAATAIAAKTAGGVSGLSEFGSDYLSIIEAMPEADRQDLNKIKEALRTAKDAALVRTGIEAALPGVGGRLGSTATRRAATELGAQMSSGALGEYAAAQVKGQEVSAGELALEALADSAGVVTEAGPTLANASRRDADDARTEANFTAAMDREFRAKLDELNQQKTADANRVKFDAEVEAEDAIRRLREGEALNNATQMEMPFGSGFGGNVAATNLLDQPIVDSEGNPIPNSARRIPENDRVPTIVDMFSGESRAAPAVQAELARRVPADQMPEETDEAFEIRTQRESTARNQIDQRKQADFEKGKQKEENNRRRLIEAQTTLKQERQLQSTADITREAKRLVQIEQEGLRRQRAGIIKDPAKMDSFLKAYERKRLPELVESVRNRRLAAINEARDLIIAEENRQVNLEDISVENELAQRQQVRDQAARKAAEPLATDLFDAPTGQQQLPLVGEQQERPRYTGELTDDQRVTELAAGQLARQRLYEKTMPAKQAAEAAAIEQELPTVSAAIDALETKKQTLTLKAYSTKEKKALKTIIEQEMDVPNDTRTVEQKKQAAAAKLAEWKAANPAPAGAPVVTDPLVKQAQTIKNRIEGREKAKETAATNRNLTKALKEGKSPEEAAATVSGRRLTKAEDAAVRKELGEEKADLQGNPFLGEEHPKDSIRNSNIKAEKANPTLYSAMKSELAKETPSITRMLDLIARDPTTTEFQKRLAFRLRPLMDKLGVSLEASPEGMESGGTFRPSNNTIYMNSLTPTLVLHEALHAALSGVVAQRSRFGQRAVKLVADLELLRLETISGLNASRMTLQREVTGPQLGNRLAEGNGPLSNVDELISYFMTEPSLQYLLNQLPPTASFVRKVRDFAERFYKAVLGFLGLDTPKNATALSELFQNVDDLLGIVEADMGTAQDVQNRRAVALAGDAVAESTFSNPTTERSFYEAMLNGRVSAKFKKEWFTSPVGTFVDALTSGAGASSVTTEIFDRTQSEAAALIHKAEQLYNAIDYSIEKHALDKGVDVEAFRNQFIADITEFEQAPAGLTKTGLAKKIADKYTLAGRSYFTMRDTIDSLSKDILAQRLADSRPFTDAEAKIYRSIKHNMGQYYSRVYAANTKGVGRERAKKLLKAYGKVAKGSTDPELMDEYKIVRDAAVFIRDHMLAIPEVDTLEDMSMAKLVKLADAWGVVPKGVADLDNPASLEDRRAQLIEALSKYSDATPESKEKRAIKLIEDMLLGKSGGTATEYFRGEKQDRTIVTEREGVPEEIRTLLGEVVDVPLRGMITIARQAEFRARNRAFNELIAAEQGNRILTDEEFTERGLSPQDWTQLSGVAYGALEDMWVRNDLARRVEDSAEVTASFDQAMAKAEQKPLTPVMFVGRKVFEQWSRLAGNLKAIQLVWNMGNIVLNFSGGPIIMLSNGTADPKHVKRALATALNVVRSAGRSGNEDADVEKVIRAGITDSAFMGDIKAVELDQLRQAVLESVRSPVGRKVSAVGQNVKTLKRAWRETYAMADVVWKIANFYAEEARLAEFYKAEGIDVSPEALEREAAWRTNVSNFSYKRVPDMFKIFEKSGLTYIMPYIYETFRAPVGSFMLGLQDMARANKATTSEGKAILQKHAVKRMMGSVLSMGIMQSALYFAAQQVAEALGQSDEEEEEWLENLKVLLPDFRQQSKYLYLGRRDGKPVLLEMSRFDPLGPASEFYRSLITEPENAVENAYRLFINNPYGTTIIQAMLGTGSTTTKMEALNPEAYESIINAGDSIKAGSGVYAAKVLDQAIPSWLSRAFDPNNKAPEGSPFNILPYLGMSLQQVDAPKTVEFKAREFNDARDELRRDLYQFLRTSTNATPEDILGRFTELQEQEKEQFSKLNNLYSGMLKLGYDPATVLGMLSAERVTDADLAVLAAGGYRPEGSGLISMRGLEQSYTRAVERAGFTEDQQKRYYNNIVKTLRLVEEGRLPARE